MNMQQNGGDVSAATPAPARAPGPGGYPVVGILPNIERNVLDFFVRMWREHGDVVFLDLGITGVKMHIIVHPDDVQHVLQDNNKNYRKGYEKVEPLIGHGLVSSEGDYWLRQRRLMQPLFNRRKIPEYLPAMNIATDELLADWHARSNYDEPLDIVHEMMKVTMRVIVRTMFSGEMLGARYGELNRAFTAALEHMGDAMFRPDFLDKLPTRGNRRFREAVEVLDNIIYDLIRQRRAATERPDDLLTLLIEAEDEETRERMTDRQIRDEVVTIFFAGHETTATALSWSFYLLSRNPAVGERVVSEVQEVLGDRTPGLEDWQKLTYTRRVFDEALRLYPPAWMFARQAIDNDNLRGYQIPAGSTLLISPYLTHRHPDFWGNPEGFDPDRFTPEANKERHRMAYFPFGGGPRLCLGNNFSLLEGPLMLAMILREFKLYLAPGHKVEVRPMAVLRPQPSVMMTVQPR